MLDIQTSLTEVLIHDSCFSHKQQENWEAKVVGQLMNTRDKHERPANRLCDRNLGKGENHFSLLLKLMGYRSVQNFNREGGGGF